MSEDLILLKLSNDGNVIWTKIISGEIKGLSIATNSRNELFFTGSFANIVDFAPDAERHYWNATTGNGIFLLNLNADGKFLKAPDFNIDQGGGATGVKLLKRNDDHMILLGNFRSLILTLGNFKLKNGSFNSNSGQSDVFITQFK